MRIEQRLWLPNQGWKITGLTGDTALTDAAELVFVFGEVSTVGDAQRFAELREFYPNATIVSCSTAGEILDTSIYDNSLVASAIQFQNSRFEVASLNIRDCENSTDAGLKLAASVTHQDLSHVLIISDGQHVNGSELVRGLTASLDPGTKITGGLAGDGTRFVRTLAGLNQPATEGTVVMIALYGADLRVGYGSVGGWDSFGPDRVITRSEGNVLYELDGQSALELYKRYLGHLASELPGSALLFPLSIRTDESDTPIVRTILSIDEEHQSMTFAGDMPVGSYARLMKANFDRLIDGAAHAGGESLQRIGSQPVQLAILISCVGRKIVLGERTEEEVEAIRHILGPEAAMIGFYSYGEISPLAETGRCELHNQTMTITTLSEPEYV